MRTTVDISPDLLARVRKLADDEGVSFKEALRRVIARGLEVPAPPAPRKLDLPTFNVGFARYFDINKVNELIGEMEDQRILRSMGLLPRDDEDS
ncbi:MAG: ribbon-helix-helix protein, CopG family [Gemmatimonadaceae bacterium]|nr:ribbon-helix-helix protein, CopG family [Gemmatimonadaceae bacterium]MCW5827103.1 ribbon-helix-helix protein, CopG family [Gemmatimonadaceae bacterium]